MVVRARLRGYFDWYFILSDPQYSLNAGIMSTPVRVVFALTLVIRFSSTLPHRDILGSAELLHCACIESYWNAVLGS